MVQFQEVWVQNCFVTSCHFQAPSYFCNQNTYNLQDWLILIACWSLIKIFCKIPFKRSISWFQNNMKTKERHVSFKDEMWPQNKMQDGKIHNKNDWQFNPFLDQPLWQYLCFAKSISITCHSEDVLGDKMINDKLLHRFLSSFAHQLVDSILAIIQLNGLKSSHDIQISCLDHIT